jgi:Cohesin loading factor
MELDYTLLIIDLAERYFETAYGNGTKSSPGFRQMPDTFCRLIATGLACLDVVLGELRSSLQPPVEAAVRLRYASVLYKETENYMDAEDMLSKGMSLCDRFRLTDLKYNMQHLLARVTFLKNPKAAVRYLDGVIRDVEAVNHVPWIYAMRFLRVALSLQMAQTQETLTALSQLKVISSLSNGRKDHAIASVANGMEALIQIHRSTCSESIEQSQHALASARSTQLNPQATNIHQLATMMYFVDVLCSVYHASQNEAQAKMTEMNTFLDQRKEDPAWKVNGEFLVPLGENTSQQSQNIASESGVVHMDANGNLFLRLQWLPKDEIYTLAYVISAAVVMPKNPLDGHQAEIYLQQASSK